MDNSTQIGLMRYIDGEMGVDEKEQFEKQLAADASLQKELNDLQLAK